jgi:hypothetical protein
MVGRIGSYIAVMVMAAGAGSASAQDRSGEVAAFGLAAASSVAMAAVPELDTLTPDLPRPMAGTTEIESLRRAFGRDRRPGGLVAMYAGLGALNALDVYSTMRALDRGARETNPVVKATAGNLGVSLAVKAATTAGSIYFAEKLWKKNRAAAIVTMAAVNVATAAVVARNLRNAR